MTIDIEALGDGGRAVALGAPPLPAQLPVLPLRDTVTFPDTLTPLAVGQERSVRLVNDVLAGDRMLVMVGSRDPDSESPGARPALRVRRRRHRRAHAQGARRDAADPRPGRPARPRRRVGRPRRPTSSRASPRRPTSSSEGPELTALMRNVQQTFSTHHRGGPVPARGAPARGRQPRRPVGALAPDRRLAADQDRGEAGAARGARRRQAAAAAVGDPRPRARGRRDRRAHPVAGAVRARQVPARVPAAPAAQGDPGGARRARPGRGRGRGAARAARRAQAARGRPQGRRPRALAARAAAPGGGRARRHPHLPGVDRVAAVGHLDRGQPRPRATRARCSTPTTTTSRRSRTASSSSSPCGG